jgi:hypothetical protein
MLTLGTETLAKLPNAPPSSEVAALARIAKPGWLPPSMIIARKR